MKKLMLFTDGSVNTQSKFGYGAYLAVIDQGLPLDRLKSSVVLKKFENTSSTKLELQTLLWALKEIQPFEGKLLIHTDSQNITGLLSRRNRLEKNNYCSKKKLPLKNSELYKEFYKLYDLLEFEIFQVQGHKQSKKKNDIDKLFTIVDRASRKALRNHT